MRSFVSSLIALAALPLAYCVPYIHVEGSNWIVNGTNARFDVIGIEYVEVRRSQMMVY